jgi:hypothetical protein
LDLVAHANAAIGGGAFLLRHLQRTSDFFDFKELQDIAFDDIVVTLDR